MCEVHICGGAEHTATEITGEVRWCFACRRRTLYRLELFEGPFSWHEEARMWVTYYDPMWRTACSECGKCADLFPGREYVYDD